VGMGAATDLDLRWLLFEKIHLQERDWKMIFNKKILCFCVFFVLLPGCAGMIKVVPPEERNCSVVFDSKYSKDTIFDMTLEWVAKNFNSSNDVIQLKNKELGKIVGVGVTRFNAIGVSFPCQYTMTIDIKNNKIRMVFDNLIGYWGENGEKKLPLENEAYINSAKESLAETAQRLNSFVANYSKSDW
jgi:hypothetical protein